MVSDGLITEARQLDPCRLDDLWEAGQRYYFSAGVEQMVGGQSPLYCENSKLQLANQIKGMPVRALFSSWHDENKLFVLRSPHHYIS